MEKYTVFMDRKNQYCQNGYTTHVLPVVRVPGRERRLLETMQLAIGEFITDSSQGLSPSQGCEDERPQAPVLSGIY